MHNATPIAFQTPARVQAMANDDKPYFHSTFRLSSCDEASIDRTEATGLGVPSPHHEILTLSCGHSPSSMCMVVTSRPDPSKPLFLMQAGYQSEDYEAHERRL